MPKRPNSPQDAVERLTELFQVKGMIPYHENIPDKEYAHIKLSVYGAPATNELFVKLTNGAVTFVDVAKSDLLHPPMADRIFGMDVLDHQTALRVADKMWEKHRTALIATPPPESLPS